MGLEEFIPPDSEIGAKHTFTGVIYSIDVFSVDVILYEDPTKKLSISKYMFTCPDSEIEPACEVRIHYWKEKDGTARAVAEIVDEKTDKEQQLKRVLELLKKVK